MHGHLIWNSVSVTTGKKYNSPKSNWKNHLQPITNKVVLGCDKKLGIKLDGDELYEEFQRIYDESVGRDADKDKAKDKMWNRGRGR